MVLVQLHPTLNSWMEHEVPDLRAEIDEIFEARKKQVAASSASSSLA